MEKRHKIVVAAIGLLLVLALVITLSVVLTRRKSGDNDNNEPDIHTFNTRYSSNMPWTVFFEKCGTLIRIQKMDAFVECFFSKSHPQPRTTIAPFDIKLPLLILPPGSYFVKRIEGDKLSNRILNDFEVDNLLKGQKTTDQELKDFREAQSKWQVGSPPTVKTNSFEILAMVDTPKDEVKFLPSKTIPSIILFREIVQGNGSYTDETLAIQVKFGDQPSDEMFLTINQPGYFEIKRVNDRLTINQWNQDIFSKVQLIREVTEFSWWVEQLRKVGISPPKE